MLLFSLSARDTFYRGKLRLVGGALLSYIINLIVAKQTEKKKILELKVVGRHILVETTPDMPFSIMDASGSRIQDVYALLIRVWNRGTDALYAKDISTQHPLTISIDRSAKVLGKPEILNPNPMVKFEAEETATNTFKCTFECLNPGEWLNIFVFTTGDPRAAVWASARVNGQNAHFRAKTDDRKASWPERIRSLVLLVMLLLSPVALLIATIWTYRPYTFTALLTTPNKLPSSLNAMFCWGIAIPSLFIFISVLNWFERKRNPKGYPIRADFPGYNTPLKVFFLEAFKGLRYRQSRSLHEMGEVVPYSNKRTDSSTPSRISKKATSKSASKP